MKVVYHTAILEIPLTMKSRVNDEMALSSFGKNKAYTHHIQYKLYSWPALVTKYYLTLRKRYFMEYTCKSLDNS